MIYFNCDYNEGAHERILKALAETNMEQTPGYGMDPYCQKAADLLKKQCGREVADIHFLVGGTQTNLTVIASSLRPHQGILAAETAHINVHETGAIEGCGHKVLTLASEDGKITAAQVEKAYQSYKNEPTAEHMVQPKMVYISNPTELGTIYTRDELENLRDVCSRNRLILFMDGARLGYGLEAEGNTLDLPCIAECCDVFYIGGTKVGALFGEAVVICNPSIKEDFRCIMKQKGAMLAKGRLLGIQFLELFRDGLYFAIAAQADRMADRMRRAFREMGYSFLVENTTNQIFPILPDAHLRILEKTFSFEYQEKVDETHTAVRFCTSWATKKEHVDCLLERLRQIGGKQSGNSGTERGE